MASQDQKTAPASDGKLSGPEPILVDGDPPYLLAFGHKYHHSGKIFVPFDEKEQRRMELQHRMIRLCLNGALTTTRIPLDVESIVDLGSGTGLWPMEMGVRYPQADILGIDISRIQRTTAIPPNVKYVIDNVEHPWPVPDASVDFLHVRGLCGGVSDWPALFKQAYDKLKPGGLLEWTEIVIEIFDFDGKFAGAELCPKFLEVWRDLVKRNNIEFNPSPNGPVWLVDAGFEQIVQRSEILPLGEWAQDDKLRTRQTLMNAIVSEHFDNHCGLVFTKCGWTREQFDAIAPSFLHDIHASSAKPYTMVLYHSSKTSSVRVHEHNDGIVVLRNVERHESAPIRNNRWLGAHRSLTKRPPLPQWSEEKKLFARPLESAA